MKAQELRIGNWVQFRHTETPVRVTLGDFVREYNDEHLEDYEPIPLTEEWLIKFGFEPNGGIHFRTIRQSAYIAIGNDGSCGLYNSLSHFNRGSSYNQLIDVEHVHQLQNLYFALTDEELTIKTIDNK